MGFNDVMTHSLAKRLKDAGFPQEIKEGDKWFNSQRENPYTVVEGECDHGEPVHAGAYCVKLPTLEELIEACGEEFEVLELSPNDRSHWIAKGGTTDNGSTAFFCDGKTPLIAVANLFLHLTRRRMTPKQTKDLETVKYFIPNGYKDFPITDADVEKFFEYSERGLHEAHKTDKIETGFDVLVFGKRRRGLHMGLWEDGVLEGTMPYLTLLEGLPDSVIDFMKKEMFKGRDAEVIEQLRNDPDYLPTT